MLGDSELAVTKYDRRAFKEMGKRSNIFCFMAKMRCKVNINIVEKRVIDIEKRPKKDVEKKTEKTIFW